MATIKGPITLGGKKPIPQEILAKAKLPFTAGNWKSKENSHLVEGGASLDKPKEVKTESEPGKKKDKKSKKKKSK